MIANVVSTLMSGIGMGLKPFSPSSVDPLGPGDWDDTISQYIY